MVAPRSSTPTSATGDKVLVYIVPSGIWLWRVALRTSMFPRGLIAWCLCSCACSGLLDAAFLRPVDAGSCRVFQDSIPHISSGGVMAETAGAWYGKTACEVKSAAQGVQCVAACPRDVGGRLLAQGPRCLFTLDLLKLRHDGELKQLLRGGGWCALSHRSIRCWLVKFQHAIQTVKLSPSFSQWCGPFSPVVLARQAGDIQQRLKNASASCGRKARRE